MTRYLITGIAGFIGSHLASGLLRDGHEVIGVDNLDDFYPATRKLRNLDAVRRWGPIDWHQLDIRDRDGLVRLIDSDTVVVHLAAKAGVRPSIAEPRAYIDANVSGTASVLEAMRTAGARRLVFASSSSVYGNSTPAPYREDAIAIEPVSPYAASKRAAELLLVSMAPLLGMTVASLRFFTVYGPRQRPDLAIHGFMRKMLAGETLRLFGDGSQGRDYTYCDDIVAGIRAAIEWTGTGPVGVETFNLGGSRVVRLDELVQAIARVLDVTPSVRWEPMQPGDVELTSADLTKSQRVLGYRPTTPLESGLEIMADWLRSEPAD